jgi:hypothetical protein
VAGRISDNTPEQLSKKSLNQGLNIKKDVFLTT